MTEKIRAESFLSAGVRKEDSDIDLGKIFRFLLMQSKLIISIVLVVFAISFLFFITAQKHYKIVSLLEYEKFDQNILDPSQVLQFTTGSTATPASNMIELYESRTNYLKIIKDLKLNIEIEGLSDNESVDIDISSKENDLLEMHQLKYSFAEDSYSLLDSELNEIQKAKYGEYISYNDLKMSVLSANLSEYRPLNINYRNPESMYGSFKSMMNVGFSGTTGNSFFMNEGLITVSYTSTDTDLGKKIINYANDIFLNQRIYDENEKSRKAINFIEKNMESIKESVEKNKTKLKQFREENKSLNVTLEIEGIISKIQSLDEALNSIDIEIAKARDIYTQNNPAYLNLVSKKALIEQQKEEVLLVIEMMPKEQQKYIDLFNELEVSQALFEQLESRRLGFSILEASTIGDVRVIDEAYVDSLVSPKLNFVIISTFVSLVIACFIAIVRGFYFLPISNPAEIFDNDIYIPIVGVVPEIENFEFNQDDIKLTSSIESLIVNINAMQDESDDNKLITITSPSPGNGKSTLSMKLAERLAKIGKKVLLVDNDLKRGKIARNYNLRSISEERFNAIDESTINKYQVHENLYIIPRVKGLKNTFQFLYSYHYKEKIKFFKDNFDYIIFDTGPVLSVADSSILIEQSGINLLVVRHVINRINEIKQSIDNFNQINKKIDGIVYNAYAKPKSYYGYYGIYGNYSYQYYAEKYLDEAYEYEKQD